MKRTQPETGHRSSILDQHQHKRMDGRHFSDSPPEMERQMVEQEEIPPTGPQIWLPPRQHPDETLVEFRNRPHQDHSTLEERTLTCPPVEARRSACIPVPRIIPDSTYGDRPPLQIERDLRGLAPIQEELCKLNHVLLTKKMILGRCIHLNGFTITYPWLWKPLTVPFLSKAQLLEWCRDNSVVWENPVRENTTHYTVEYTCKTVLVVSYHALGCERTCIVGNKSLVFIHKGLFILVCV